MSVDTEWFVAFLDCETGTRAAVGVPGHDCVSRAVADARAKLEAGGDVWELDGEPADAPDWVFVSAEKVSSAPLLAAVSEAAE